MFTLRGVSRSTSASAAALRISSNRAWMSSATQFEHIKVETKGKVGIVTLHRPKALNALCSPLINEVNEAFSTFDQDANIGCIVLTGSEKAFAAGADIKEMADLTYPENRNMFSNWDDLTSIKKPIIAAVRGFALGGGCELMMMCDFAIAGEGAKFGQPEIKLGTIPGVGGTQRLTRAVGKSKAMDLVLTGRFMDANEAQKAGLVSRVVPDQEVLETAIKSAETIASFSKPIVSMAKECVNKSFETTLAEGVNFERRVFQSTFATKDQKIGMKAFVEKAKPDFVDQ